MKYIPLALIAVLTSCTGIRESRRFSSEFNSYQRSYKDGFLINSRSPLGENDLDSLDFYPPNISWRIDCACKEAIGAEPFDMPTYSGVSRRYVLYAVADCQRGSKKFTVSLYQNIHPPINPLYQNQLFLPFKDATNGEGTYGGGRYINLNTTSIRKGKITIDFNRSYNPWCAYSDGYNCPIPPKDNHFEFEVNAGEKMFMGHYKQGEKQ